MKKYWRVGVAALYIKVEGCGQVCDVTLSVGKEPPHLIGGLDILQN
jgi:hypothetical protein